MQIQCPDMPINPNFEDVVQEEVYCLYLTGYEAAKKNDCVVWHELRGRKQSINFASSKEIHCSESTWA